MRIGKIVLTKLIHKRLVAYEKLERAMNSNDKIAKITPKIERLLKKITLLNGSIATWEAIIPNDELGEIKDNENE